MGRKSILGTQCVSAPMDQTRRRIEKMEAEREERRRAMKEMRVERAEEEQRNIAQGNPGDVDFIGLVKRWREEHFSLAQPHRDARDLVAEEKICVCVRKRPLNEKELQKREHDAVTCFHPTATIHSAKLRVDGISKYCDHNSFRFDHAFDEVSTTEDVYAHTAKPLVGYVCGGNGVKATVFAYGQTGSGKTHTMSGIQRLVAEDIFLTLSNNPLKNEGCSLDNTSCSIAIFEIYGGFVLDLLNNRTRLKVLEDGKGEVNITGLEEFAAKNPRDFLTMMETAQNNRTTHATEANDSSSRSHAICQILFRDKNSGRLKGKLSLVDLAGSERGTDTKSHNKTRRTESSEINTSLLSLKECIRSIDSDSRHVPYRQSKLTLILKDCFVSKLARTAMIATLSPGSSSTDHTINTLRYADRIKEKVPSFNTEQVGDLIRKETKSKKMPIQLKEGLVQMTKLPIKAKVFEKPVLTNEDYINGADKNKLVENARDDVGDNGSTAESKELSDFDQAVMNLLDEEEHLLNLHMSVIQEKAELLTEESKLLNTIQDDEDDMDQYALRLGVILDRKTTLVQSLQERLAVFREQLKKKEDLSHKIGFCSNNLSPA